MAACQPLVNSAIAFTNTLPRNTFRQPGTYYQNTAVLKNFGLTREAMKLQFRASSLTCLIIQICTSMLEQTMFLPRCFTGVAARRFPA